MVHKVVEKEGVTLFAKNGLDLAGKLCGLFGFVKQNAKQEKGEEGLVFVPIPGRHDILDRFEGEGEATKGITKALGKWLFL